ncbi:MAG: rhomboid family intramembrane serine protease [Pseudomonadota bacterium]
MLWGMVALWTLIHGASLMAEQGIGPSLLQPWMLYTMFAFFDVKLSFAMAGRGVDPQLVWSTVTHAFLHGSWLHLALNAAAFLGLGHALSRDGGIWPTLAIFVLTAAAGALTFGAVAAVEAPLIGASGAVFGFLGTLTAWQARWLAARGGSLDPIWARVAGVIAVNAIMAVGFGGVAIAWEAHLGGFAAGWALAYAFPPRLRTRRMRERMVE